MHIFGLGSSLKVWVLSYIIGYGFFQAWIYKRLKICNSFSWPVSCEQRNHPILSQFTLMIPSVQCWQPHDHYRCHKYAMLFFFILFIKFLEKFSPQELACSSELMNTLIKAFSSDGNVDSDLFHPIDSYFEHLSVPTGLVLWTQYDISDGLYIIESGVLRASYEFANPVQHFEESMVAGTLSAKSSALSDSIRNATVIIEQAAVLWKLSI